MNELRKKRTFTQDFKLGAVKLVTEQGYSITQAAQAMGITSGLMGKWINIFSKNNNNPEASFPGKGNLNPQDAEIESLKKQVKKLSIERDILKKAMAYFTPQPE